MVETGHKVGSCRCIVDFARRHGQPISDCSCWFSSYKSPHELKTRNKKVVLSQGNRAMPQLFFSVWSSPTTFTKSLRVAKLRKQGFRAPNMPAKTEFNAKWPLKVMYFSVSGKAIRPYLLRFRRYKYNARNFSSTKDPQFFRGSQIFCGSRSASAHLCRLRDTTKIFYE